MLDPTIRRPAQGRTFSARRRVRLADLDPSGRVRLDAIARLLQDVAIDDVQETGWGTPEHLWFVRRIRVEIDRPFLEDREIELVTWCSGLAALSAGRRWSLAGDRGGRAEVDSVWIHLDAEQRPARIDGFDVYGESADGRRVSTKLELPEPPADASAQPWPLRASDLDLHGHVNNSVYWQAVEDALADLHLPLVAELDFREPVDAGDELELVRDDELVGFRVDGAFKAVARVAAR